MARKKATETTNKKTPAKKTTTKKTVAKTTTKTAAKKATTKKTPTVRATKTNNVSDSYVFRVVAIALLVINALVGIANLLQTGGEYDIQAALQQHEAAKMGGEEVYEVFEKLINSEEYQTQQLETFNNLLSQLQGANNPTAAQVQEPTPTQLTDNQVDDILQDRPLMGNENAEIVIIEYTDIECPFCKRLHDSGVMDQLIANNPDIAVTYKHFPLSFHPNAQPAAEAAESIRVHVGDEAYFAYKNEIFKAGSINRDSIIKAAVAAGANQAQIEADLDAGTYTAEVQAQMNEGGSVFGVTGTPGNAIINIKTGEFEVVSGAAPLANFQTAIDNIK